MAKPAIRPEPALGVRTFPTCRRNSTRPISPGASSAWRGRRIEFRQFAVFITTADAGFLDSKYTAFGEVTSGMDVVDKIKANSVTGQQWRDPESRQGRRHAHGVWREVIGQRYEEQPRRHASTLETSKGPVVIEMNPALAPGRSQHIKRLVGEGFYDGIVFHRVIGNFMARTGSAREPGPGVEISSRPSSTASRTCAEPFRWPAPLVGFGEFAVLHLLC